MLLRATITLIFVSFCPIKKAFGSFGNEVADETFLLMNCLQMA